VPIIAEGEQAIGAVAASLASPRLLNVGRIPFTVQIGSTSGGDKCDAAEVGQDLLLTTFTLPGTACQAGTTFAPGNSQLTLARHLAVSVTTPVS
jgi:hypothetical protein